MSVHADHQQVLIVRRFIPADPAIIFSAWTEPEQLIRWWGPVGTVCTHAEVDLRVGGEFRLATELPDGQVIWISGRYVEIDRPSRLRYTWRVQEEAAAKPSIVVITFDPLNGGTEVVITHTNIATQAIRDSHQQGWQGCLDGLSRHTLEPHAAG